MKLKNNSGFTLIETFVAITVLMITVLGPMSLLSRALVYSNQIKNEMIASGLAQEGVEVVIYLKNINAILPPIGDYCVDSRNISPLIPKTTDCKVKTDNNGYYGDSNVADTIFTRVVNITVGEEANSEKIITCVSWLEKGVGKNISSISYIYR